MFPRHTFLSGSIVERTNAPSAWHKEEQIFTDDLSGIFFKGRRANFMVACSLLVVVLIIILADESKVPQWTPPEKPQEQPVRNNTPGSRFPVAVLKKDLEEFHKEYFGHLNNSIHSVYGDGAYLEGYITGPYAESHGSNLLLMPNGELLCVWFCGVEGRGGTAIVMSRLPRGARQWSEAVIIAEESASSCQNPVLFYDAATELLTLLHTAQQAGKGQGTSSVRLLTSTYGPELHWSRPLPLAFGPGAFIRNQLLRGESEHWLLPMYYTPNGTRDKALQYASVARTNDGSQWSEVQVSKPGSGLVQPTIVRISNEPGGTYLVAFFRDRDRRAVSRAFSYDDGRSWTEPEATQLPNNNKAIQAHFSPSTGSLLIVFNNAKGPKIRGEDLKNWPISIAISKDAGITWPYVRDLQPDFDPMLEYSYPSIQQGDNGELHISYTWSSKGKRRVCIRYVRITEDWIERSWPKGSTQGEFKGDGVRWGDVKRAEEQQINRIIDQAEAIMNKTEGQAMIDNAFMYRGQILSAQG